MLEVEATLCLESGLFCRSDGRFFFTYFTMNIILLVTTISVGRFKKLTGHIWPMGSSLPMAGLQSALFLPLKD